MMLQKLLLLSGKKLYALCFVIGALSSLAFAPVFMAVLLIPTFSLLLILIERQSSARKAFFVGWWFGFGHFTTGLYWIAFALLVDGSPFYWLVPFAVLGIPFLLAFFVGISCYFTYRFFTKGIYRWLGFCGLWVISEYARAYLFTGFPWNLLGYSLAFSDELIQLASVVSVYGLSFVVVLVSTSLYYLMCGQGSFTQKRYPFILSLILLCGVWLFGYIRLDTATSDFNDDITLRIVQANIAQSLKWDPKRSQSIVQKHVDLTLRQGREDIDYVIWPESAIPYALPNDSVFFQNIAPIIPKSGALITGMVRTGAAIPGIRGQVWNSLEVLDDRGRTFSYYDKHHLVPFGEYVPLRDMIPFALQKVTSGSTDFSRGAGAQTIALPGHGIKISPLICYESIFPRHAINHDDDRPDILMNITNDGWYGYTSGPFQHFHTARMRAVEQGIPMVRAANTGVSAVIDAYGRVLQKTPLGEAAFIDSKLPVLLDRTTYGRFGNLPLFAIVAFILCFCFFRQKV